MHSPKKGSQAVRAPASPSRRATHLPAANRRNSRRSIDHRTPRYIVRGEVRATPVLHHENSRLRCLLASPCSTVSRPSKAEPSWAAGLPDSARDLPRLVQPAHSAIASRDAAGQPGVHGCHLSAAHLCVQKKPALRIGRSDAHDRRARGYRCRGAERGDRLRLESGQSAHVQLRPGGPGAGAP